MKALHPVQLSQLAEQIYRTWCVDIDPKTTPIQDLFRPQFWANASKIAKGDLIRVRATDGSYNFFLQVEGTTIGGKLAARVSIFPNIPDYVREAASCSTEMIPTTINGKAVPRYEYVPADAWRVIGFDGNVTSRLHESEAAAAIAMAAYINVYGFKTVADQPPVDAKTGEERTPRAAPSPDAPAQPDLNVSFAKRKEVEAKAKKEAQRAADMKRLEERRAANAAEPAA